MTRAVHIEITSDRVIVRGNLDEFEATAYLQEALNAQALQQERAKRANIWATGSALFYRYQALLIYPLFAAFLLGLAFGLPTHQTPPQIQEQHYEPY